MENTEPIRTPKEDIDIDKFFAADHIQGCEEGLWVYYQPANEVFYRLVHNPINPNDQIPKSLRKIESLVEEEIDLDVEIVEQQLSIEEQKSVLNDFGLSGFVSEEQLRQFMLKYVKRQSKKQLPEWLENMGDSIAKYNLLPEVGYIEKDADEKGHKNLHYYNGIDLDDYRDEAFGYHPLIENE